MQQVYRSRSESRGRGRFEGIGGSKDQDGYDVAECAKGIGLVRVEKELLRIYLM